jgi:NAD(P)-dependent dehydrogenase (short-subunit alcohol dehydrogenase family)
MPQIEVEFNIDANGILNVSAKDWAPARARTSRSRLDRRPVRGRDREDEEGRRGARRRGQEAPRTDRPEEPGRRPIPSHSAYCASKAALVNLVYSQSRQLAPDVTVNGIAPGVVDWPEHYSEEFRNQYLTRVPLGRSGTPMDVARLVHYLADEGSYVTGQIIRLDGGRSIA